MSTSSEPYVVNTRGSFRDCGGGRTSTCRPGADCHGCRERERVYLQERHAKCEAAVELWKGGSTRMEAIDAMPDRSWGCELPKQWHNILDTQTLCPVLFGPSTLFDLSAAASATCAAGDGEIGTVMMVFDASVFLSVAQDNVDGRGDASLLRFDRAEIEQAVRECGAHPLRWFHPSSLSERLYPSALLLPREFEGIPSQKKRERSFGWHLVAYEELVARHGSLVAATAMEDCEYASEYGPTHPTYGYVDPTNGNCVCFDPTVQVDAKGTTRSGFSRILLQPADGRVLGWGDLNEHQTRASTVLMELLWKNYAQIAAEMKGIFTMDDGRKIIEWQRFEAQQAATLGYRRGIMVRPALGSDGGGGLGGRGASRSLQDACAHPRLAAFTTQAGTIARGRAKMRYLHAVLRELVHRNRAAPKPRTTRGMTNQQRVAFIYYSCPADIFRNIVALAEPELSSPPPLDPTRSSLTGGQRSDGGGCCIM